MAKDNLELTRRGTLVHKRRAITGEGKRRRARTLEELRIDRSLTRFRTTVMVSTTQLVRIESLAPTLTRHHSSVTLP